MSTFENQVSDIVRLFRTGLGRNPEAAAIDTFVGLLEQGATFHDIAHIIAGSSEFCERHGAVDVCTRDFARFLYHNGLDRLPDSGGEENILRTPSRGDAIEIIADSKEARENTDLLGQLFPNGVPLQDNLAYRLWLHRYSTLSRTERIAISGAITSASERGMPRHDFCLLVLAQNDRPDLLAETAASLEAQIHSGWTLWIVHADDAPASVHQAIATLARRVPGISAIPVPRHLSQGERWQEAINRSEGEFCGFLYPGDQLEPDALYRFAAAIDAYPDSSLLYCDEDVLDSDGERSNPLFKPAWHRDLLYVGDVTGQLAMFRRDRALAVGGVRHDGGEFSRYELMLRITEGLAASSIRHIPRVLYHRGRGPGRETGFPYVRATVQHPSILGTVERHLLETGSGIKMRSVYIGGAVWPRIVYPLPDIPPLVSIILPTRDQAAMLETCVRGLLDGTDYPSIEILIADNDSREIETLETLRQLARDRRVSVTRRPGAFNWSAINNAMVAQATGTLLVFLNDDIEMPDSDWLAEMVRQAMQPGVGVVGARLLYPDGGIQHAGIAMTPTGARHILRSEQYDPPEDLSEDGPEALLEEPRDRPSDNQSGYMGQIVLAREVAAVTGACMMVHRVVFDALGGFDESFPLTCNDVDFCLRARDAGFRVVWTPHATLTHIDGGTRGRDHTARQIVQACLDNGQLLDRWGRAGANDPYVNANLMVNDNHMLLKVAPARIRVRDGRTRRSACRDGEKLP